MVLVKCLNAKQEAQASSNGQATFFYHPCDSLAQCGSVLRLRAGRDCRISSGLVPGRFWGKYNCAGVNMAGLPVAR